MPVNLRYRNVKMLVEVVCVVWLVVMMMMIVSFSFFSIDFWMSENEQISLN